MNNKSDNYEIYHNFLKKPKPLEIQLKSIEIIVDENLNSVLFFKVWRNIFLKHYILKYLRDGTIKFNMYNCKENGSAVFKNENHLNIPRYTYYYYIYKIFLNKDEFIKYYKSIKSFELTSKRSQSGSVFSNYKIPLSTDTLFKFSFNISVPKDGNKGGDGFAFVLQNKSNSCVLAGGECIGYDGMDCGLVAIEFDTYQNKTQNDLNDNHISIQGKDSNNLLSTNHDYSLALINLPFKIKDGNWHNVEIKFHRQSTSISVFVDSIEFISNIHIPYLVNIDSAYCGFTSGTGNYYSTHNFSNFEMFQL